jgi:hypothetical protein
MFRRLLSFALPLAVCCGIAISPEKAHAQPKVNVGQLLSGLINVNVSNIDVNVVDVIDVNDVLNNAQIDILRNAIQNNPIASNNQNVLNNLLREADIIDDVTVVVGVLSGQRVLVLPAP